MRYLRGFFKASEEDRGRETVADRHPFIVGTVLILSTWLSTALIAGWIEGPIRYNAEEVAWVVALLIGLPIGVFAMIATCVALDIAHDLIDEWRYRRRNGR